MSLPTRLSFAAALGALALACSGGDTAPVTSASAPVVVATPTPASCSDTLATYSGRFQAGAVLSVSDVLEIPAERRRFVRNEIFARYGRAFSSQDLQAHFAEQSWYCQDSGFQDSMLSKSDRANVNLIKSFEGDNSAKLQAHGQLTQDTEFDGFNLIFQTDDRLEIIETSGSMYGWEPESRYWSSQGEWVITWNGSESYGASSENAMAWHVNVKKGTLLDHQGTSL